MLRHSYAYKTSLLTRVPPRYLRFFCDIYFSEIEDISARISRMRVSLDFVFIVRICGKYAYYIINFASCVKKNKKISSVAKGGGAESSE